MNLLKDAGYVKDEFGCNLPSCECAEPTSLTFGDIDVSWIDAEAFIPMRMSGHQSFLSIMTTIWDQHRDPNTGKYIIAYSMDLGFDRREMQPILDAIKAIEDVSCIKFELLTQQKVPHKHSILFSKSNRPSKFLRHKVNRPRIFQFNSNVFYLL